MDGNAQEQAGEAPASPHGQEAHETFDESALLAAAVEASEAEDNGPDGQDGQGDGEKPEGSAVQGGSDGSNGSNGLPGLEDLRKVAAERAKAYEAQKQPSQPGPNPSQPGPNPSAAQPDLSQLVQGMTGAADLRAAAEALKEGDGSKIAQLVGVDEATLYERWTDRALRGDTSSLEQQLKSALKRIDELEGKKTPDDVVTMEKLEQRELEARYAENRGRFQAMLAGGEHPTLHVLSQIDPQLALNYGEEAEGLLRANELPLTIENIARYAEQLAHEKHGGLFQAQQRSGHAQPAASASTEAAAPSAEPGSKKRPVTIDNRAAAEVASSLPDFEDEAAYVARARAAAESL